MKATRRKSCKFHLPKENNETRRQVDGTDWNMSTCRHFRLPAPEQNNSMTGTTRCDHYPPQAARRRFSSSHLLLQYCAIVTLISYLIVAVMLFSKVVQSQQLSLASDNKQITNSSIIIDQQSFSGAQLLPVSSSNHNEQVTGSARHLIGAHLQPSFVLGARNKSMNFTRLQVDELTGSIYVGATNWLLQLSALNLRPEVALKTGPASENSRDCAPADCLAHLAQVDAGQLPVHHAHGPDLGVPNHHRPARPNGLTMHTASSSPSVNGSRPATRPLQATPQTQSQLPTAGSGASTATTTNSNNNNYNKILALDPDGRQLIVCGSLNQGACRRHQLGQLGNFSELIPLPVVPNDEHSSSVALISRTGSGSGAAGSRVMYVAATNSRLGPYREMVPAISARYLEPHSRAIQIIERGFTETARVDISFELRDYYLVNYVSTFQHGEFIYFATVQRKSPLRQLEEWGYITRLARLCLSDLSFQSYAELTLECRSHSQSGSRPAQTGSGQQLNYNLLQDAHLTSASSHLAQQLGLRPQAAVLVAAFAQSRDHTTRSQQKSAICLYPLDRIEQKFNENIHQCYNGSSRARNMNYIAGSVNDCPKPGKAGNIANFCNEPLKLNGSLPLQASPVISFDSELITSIQSTQAPTAPINLRAGDHQQTATGSRHLHNQVTLRQHQVLIAGTGDGQLKRIALVSGDAGFGLRGLEFEQIPLEPPEQQEPILSDLHLWPAHNPQLAPAGSGHEGVAQFAIAATPRKVVKLRINSCKAPRGGDRNQSTSGQASDSCQQCAQLQDPFCGWCSSAGACLSRDECLGAAAAHQSVHWSPFDQIRCADYQPIAPRYVSLHAGTGGHQQPPVDVNVRLPAEALSRQQPAQQLAQQLAQAQFTCHWDYLALANRSLPAPKLSGATTKATQPRLNLHTGTVAIGCPLPPPAQRPPSATSASGELRVRLGVRLSAGGAHHQLALTTSGQSVVDVSSSGSPSFLHQTMGLAADAEIEREVTLYDCSVRSTCRSCLSGSGSASRAYSCAWCPLSNRCTFNASHPELGCAASAIISTTPQSAVLYQSPGGQNQVRASHLASSLDQAQASVFGLSVSSPEQCPATASETQDSPNVATSGPPTTTSGQQFKTSHIAQHPRAELLVPNNARRSLQFQLAPAGSQQLLLASSATSGSQLKKPLKLECLFELEGAKARVGARLIVAPGDGVTAMSHQQVVCQETQFSYQEEISTQRAQLFVILNDNQVIDMIDVILYKCHLFGVNPPALTSTAANLGSGQQHSSAAWRAHEFLQFQSPGTISGNSSIFRRHLSSHRVAVASSDCSLCLNVERKFQCVWCANQCQHADYCAELPASTCPPPRIDSIHPTSGPIEGGTLLTIEGSNLGSNEREIQDKITVGGEPCALVMYSVSTRIVCKTGQSLHGPQAATVFVGNRAGVTSAFEKFHYKAVHLRDVNPRIGPVSGGTRLYLTGSNLNTGSRVQIFLDDIPCSLDSNEISSQQISCITAPNLLASSMRISRLTLMIDNSTHYLPYPFTYQPDPIITAIEPAESFVSGGRLIMIFGQHLASPQSTRLMVYHEHKHQIINATTCILQNDTLITCLTPALSREMLASALSGSSGADSYDQQQLDQMTANSLSYDSGGLKLKMSLFMDDVRSVRNLDEYYHHLPHYLTYFEDPQLFRLSPSPEVEPSEELVIQGENLRMRQLDQDMLITIGQHHCPIKSISGNQVTCLPPAKIRPTFDELGRPSGLLPIVALIGENLRFQLGHMQYSSRQFELFAAPPAGGDNATFGSISHTLISSIYPSMSSGSGQLLGSSSGPNPDSSGDRSNNVAILVTLSSGGFIIGLIATLMFALSRFRHSKAEREYKRIQLQMGSLDIGNQPLNATLFDQINPLHFNKGGHSAAQVAAASSRSRALDYVGGALSGKKLFYQFSPQQRPLPQTSFPPSPLTDISSLTGSTNKSPLQQQHVIKLSANGTIVNSTAHQSPLYHSAASASPGNNSSQSPSSSTRGAGGQQQQSSPFSMQQQFQLQQNQHPHPLIQSLDNKGQQHPLSAGLRANGTLANGTSRNFNWTQEAPSTIVPYAVIEACNLSLEGGKNNNIKEYV